MSYTPHKYLKKALVKKLGQMGYAKKNGYPRVEVYNFDTTPIGAKEDKDYVVTFIIEAIDESTSPSASLEIIEDIRDKINDTLVIEGWKVVYLAYELLTELEEITDTDNNIWRQIQRVRIQLNKL